MFTGLVEELGAIKSIHPGAQSLRIIIRASKVLEDVKIGDSIAVNGTCLTVTAFDGDSFTADVMPETVKRTVLAHCKAGDPVNLERTLRLCDRLGGHLVSGHVDGVGAIRSKTPVDNAVIVAIDAPPSVMRLTIVKGSVAIDGISLTVVETGEEWFSVSLIPHSYAHTTLGKKRPGDKVNLEADMIGKYVEHLLRCHPVNGSNKKQDGSSIITMDYLRNNGFM